MWRVNLLLIVLGAIGGAVAAIPLTYLGKWIAGAPDPATVANYLWNMGAFAVMGGLFSPTLTWSAMRRVPLWRAVVEPAIGGVVGSILGFLSGSGAAFLLLAASGIGVAAWRLNYAYRERDMRFLPASPGTDRERRVGTRTGGAPDC